MWLIVIMHGGSLKLGPLLVKKFPTFYRTLIFTTSFKSDRHLSLSLARSIQFMPPCPTSWSLKLLLSSFTLDSQIHIKIRALRPVWIYVVCSKIIRIGIVVVVYWVGCVCNQSWHVRTCLSNSWHKFASGSSALIRHTVQPFTESDDTRCFDNTICSPEDVHVDARNMSRIVM